MANLGLLGGVTENRRLLLRDLCRIRPDRKQWSAEEESKRVGSGEIMTSPNGVRAVEEPEIGPDGSIAGDVVGNGGGGMGRVSGVATG